MKEINCTIGQLVSFIELKSNKKIQEDSFIEVPFDLEFPGFNLEWNKCSKFYKKKAPIYEIDFGYTKIKGADDHILVDKNKLEKKIKNFNTGDKYLDLKCISNKKIFDCKEVFSPQIESEDHIYQTLDGSFHLNTTEIENKAKDYLLPGWELVSESGTIGNSMTAIVPFIYKNSQNKIIILDDINTIFKTNYRDPVLNFMMAVLDKKAATTKPIKVDKSQLSRYSRQLENIEIFIDKNKLKEGILSIKADNQIIYNEHISLKESQDLNSMITSVKEPIIKNKYGYLKEINNKQFMKDLEFLDDDEEDFEVNDEFDYDDEENTFDPTQVPERFNFNSRIIMITNVKMTEINQAFRERCLIYFIEFSIDQYIERLETVLPNILKDDLDVTPEIINWAKDFTHKSLVLALRAFKHDYPIQYKSGGQTKAISVEINRDLTFRLFEELVQKWIVFATKRLGNNIKIKNLREDMSKKLVKSFVILEIIPFLKSNA
jgi:hypothetical protein